MPDFSEQLVWIYAVCHQLSDAVHCCLTVSSVCHTKPYRRCVKHLNSCRTTLDEFVHHQWDEELSLQILHVLRITEERLEFLLTVLEVVGSEAPHVHADRHILVQWNPLSLLVLVADGIAFICQPSGRLERYLPIDMKASRP